MPPNWPVAAAIWAIIVIVFPMQIIGNHKTFEGQIPFAQGMLLRSPVTKHTDFELLNINIDAKYVFVNVEVHRTGFNITVPGKYWLYSNILYKPPKLCSQLPTTDWTHKIKMRRSGQPTKAKDLVSKQYNCTTDTVIVKETSFIGVSAYLEVGDFPYVEVSSQAPLENKSTHNYFGLHLTGTKTSSSRQKA